MVAPDAPRPPVARRAAAALALAGALSPAAGPAALRAQSLDDGFFLGRGAVRAGVEYGAERWDEYWEGTLLRTNGNIGAITTRAATAFAGYGVARGLNVFATLPYVATNASQGVLQGKRGAQDVTVGAKYRLLTRRVAGRTGVALVATGLVGAPTTNYNIDFLPLSIGLGARRARVGGLVHAQDRTGLFAAVTGGYTWRSTVRLDRPAYFTDGQLFLTNEVAMPDVADYTAMAGFQNARWCLPVMLTTQRTLGGGDIRRQDMPFVSNRFDFTRLAARVMYTLPQAPAVQLQVGAVQTLAGRNVGRGTALLAGAAFQFRP